MEENNEVVAEMGEASLEERRRTLEMREDALYRREREARCREALRERQLPDALIACLDLSSDERAEETLDTMGGAFSEALQQQLRERLGGEPPRVSAAALIDPLAAVRAAMGLNQ